MDRFPSTSWDPDRADILALLADAPVLETTAVPWSSNHVLLLRLAAGAIGEGGAGEGYAIYKPLRGEAPLWDFPSGLYKREIASFLLSEALGWRLVPPTISRSEGLAHGVGALQLFIPADQTCTYFDLRDAHADVMRHFAAFDWLANNADRKGGHVLFATSGQIWGIDHGLAFHAEDKLRTVIWDYAGEPVPAPLLDDVERVAADLDTRGDATAPLHSYLDTGELQALSSRAAAILKTRHFPEPPDWRRPYPWPLI